MIRIIKIAWIFFWTGLITITFCIPVIICAVLFRSGNPSFSIAVLWAWAMLIFSGVRTETVGLEHIEPGQSYIVIANHQSHYDAPAIMHCLGIQFRWIIKKELRKIPVFGYTLDVSKHIFVDRSDREKAIQSINNGIRRLPPGASVLFFAEGSRSPNGKLQEFRKGGFITAIQTGRPILPVTINGSHRVLPKGSIVFTPGTIQVVIGAPIETKDLSMGDLGYLMAKTRQVIKAGLKNVN